ncbi:MAG TPA: helix-turn-helix transcriptional regulator [Allosphingosinicella sp.]|nr:helix-turn-helix transcriptional regulator [Allosphingosinicella sp.]
MDEHRLSRLTEKQRECLRLVYAHHSSKEIAPRLGVEPGTVDQYVKAAMRTLGVSDRRHAAVMLAEHEAKAGQPLVYQPLDIAPAADLATFGASTEELRKAPDQPVREPGAVVTAFPPPQADMPKLPLSIRGGVPGDLSAAKRLGWIFALILLIVLGFGLFVTGLEALSRLGRALG